MASDPLVELRADLRKRLFDRLDKRSSAFTTLFGGLLAFALVFAAIVLVPYFRLGQQQSAIGARADEIAAVVLLKQKRVVDLQSQVGAVNADYERKQAAFAAASPRLAKADVDGAAAQRVADEAATNLAAANAAVAEARQRATALAALPRALPQIAIDPRREAQDLARFITQLEPAYFRGDLPDAQTCRQPDRDAWLGCVVHARMRARGDAMVAQLRADLIDRATTADPALRAELEQKVDTFRAELNRRLLDNPRFWTRFDAKLALSGEIAAVLERSVAELLQIVRADIGRREGEARAAEAEIARLTAAVEPLRAAAAAARADLDARRAETAALLGERDAAAAAISEARARLDAVTRQVELETAALAVERATLEADKQRLDLERVEVTRRLERIQTPFGTLPIGAADGILIFPILIAAGFLVAALTLADAARLKAELRRSVRDLDREGRAWGDDRMALVAPLWFDPARRRAARLGLGIVFALPPLVALAAGAIIVAEWSRPDSKLAGPDLQFVYGALYVVSAALIALGIVQVRAAFAQLADGSEAAPAADATASAIG